MKESLYSIATDPQQYNNDRTGWEVEGAGLNSPSRAFFWEYLESLSYVWQEKSVLDIGSGNGWLLDLISQSGALKVYGIEPAEKNVLLSQQLYPHIPIAPVPFEQFNSLEQFDLILAVMSLVHIGDLPAAYHKVSALLKPHGQFFVIEPDFDRQRRQRHGYTIFIEDLNPDEFVTSVTRPTGTIVDIVRRHSVHISCAEQAGLILSEIIPLYPTRKLIESAPRFKNSEKEASTHMLRFKTIG